MSVASSSSPGDPVTDRLRAVRLFAHLTEPELVRIAEAARERHYPRNSVILFTDDPGDALYIVLQGEVKVVLVGEDGREVILTILGAGEFFGEMALIDDQPRSAHVIATTDATLLVLRRDDFHRCLEESPRIALGLLRELFARLLLELAGEHGGTDIPRTVTQHTIAQMVGSSRETVSRTLREFQDQRLIGMTKDRIQLLDRPRLARLAGLP
jgi:CRP/FNR family cyclic AMP-dependent transcriptional regulator